MKIRSIAAVSLNGVIGTGGDLPWKGKYKEDMAFFRKMTAGGTVICGRNTYESFGAKPLPKRRNIVVSGNDKYTETGAEVFSSLHKAITNTYPLIGIGKEVEAPDVWLIGGFNIYNEGMEYVDEIYLTLIPEIIKGDNLTYFPWINPKEFKIDANFNLENSDLEVIKYARNFK